MKRLCRQRRSPSPRRCNHKCNRYTVTPSHSVQLDAISKKRYSPLPSRLSSILSGLSRSGEVGSVGFCKPQVGGSIPLASSIFRLSIQGLVAVAGLGERALGILGSKSLGSRSVASRRGHKKMASPLARADPSDLGRSCAAGDTVNVPGVTGHASSLRIAAPSSVVLLNKLRSSSRAIRLACAVGRTVLSFTCSRIEKHCV